jgi:hypothetical protein
LQAIKPLDDDEKMTLRNSEGHSGQRGGAQMFSVVNESGLYMFIMWVREMDDDAAYMALVTSNTQGPPLSSSMSRRLSAIHSL